MDNHELEKLMNINVETATIEEQNRFLNKLKESQLFLPVTMSENIIKEAENTKAGDVIRPDEVGFSINYLTDEDGNRVVPLFTSEEQMGKAGIKTSTMAFHMSDLADMMRQAGDKYHTLAINPFTDSNINMPIPIFIGLFDTDKKTESFKVILKLLKEKYEVLDEEYAFYHRSDDNMMMANSNDDVFSPSIPFNVSSNRESHNDLKYLDIILMPKDSRILFIGDILGPDQFDTVIAPQSKFRLVESLDEYTNVWRCEYQPFYD